MALTPIMLVERIVTAVLGRSADAGLFNTR
jgi:hypothetical protein